MAKIGNSEGNYFEICQCNFELLKCSPEFSLFHCNSYFVELLG